MSTAYTFDLPVMPEQLEAIGMVAVEWSYLESVIDAAIWNTAQFWDEDVGEAVTSRLAVKARLDMLATLYDLHLRDSHLPAKAQDKQRRAFQSLRGEIEALAGKRNDFVHRRWVRGEQGSPLMYIVQARKGRLTRTRRGWPAAEIRAVAGNIARKAAELRELFAIRAGD